MSNSVIFLIFLSLLALLVWAFKSKRKPQKRSQFKSQPDIDIVQQLTVDSVRGLVEIINESLQIANQSHNADTKMSRLDLAKARLVELKAIVKEHPYINLTQLPEVERSIASLETEFDQTNIREAAEGNLRGQTLEKDGRVDEAIIEYERLLNKRVYTPYTYRRLAIIYSKRNNKDEELRVLCAAVKNVPVENGKHYQWFAERLAKKS